MAITTGTVNAPPTGTNPILVATNVTNNLSTGDVQMVTLIDPDSASQRVMSITANGIAVDGSGATQPVSGTVSVTALPAGANNIGGVEIFDAAGTNKLAIDGSGRVGISNFPSPSGGAVNSTGTGQFTPIADSYVALNITTATTTQVIAGVALKNIYVTGYEWVSNGAGTVQFSQNATAVTGPMNVQATFGSARNGGVIWKIPTGNSLSIITTASATVQGSISYTIF